MEIQQRQPWNKGKLVGQKAPLKLCDIYVIRTRLQLRHRTRDLALFNLAIDSKLRACDLVKLRVLDVAHRDQVASRAMVMQQNTKRPVQFEITESTKDAFLFPNRVSNSPHLSTRQYARILRHWVAEIGLGRCRVRYVSDATHEGVAHLPATKKLRAVQLFLGHATLESTVRYLGIKVDDALQMAEQTEV